MLIEAICLNKTIEAKVSFGLLAFLYVHISKVIFNLNSIIGYIRIKAQLFIFLFFFENINFGMKISI